MAGTRTDRVDMDRKNARERSNYRRSSDLLPEELKERRRRQREYMREYTARKRDEINAKRSVREKPRIQAEREKVLDALGGICKVCGWTDRRVLQVDHIDGGGCAHRARGGGVAYWRSMLSRLAEFQLLCANCHMLKSYRAT